MRLRLCDLQEQPGKSIRCARLLVERWPGDNMFMNNGIFDERVAADYDKETGKKAASASAA